MFAILLPVKEFARAKQRQAGWLTPAERERLARAMFEDVWETLRLARARHRLMVVTSEPEVITRCRAESVDCCVEIEPRGHSDAVRAGTSWAMERGITSLLSIPIDTPAMTAAEICELADLSRKYAVVVVPSADGTGTNALLRTPPDAIRPQFGPGSCSLHIEQARAAGLSHLIHPIPSFGADIDTRDDASRFLALNRDCRTASLLREWIGAGRDERPDARRKEAVCS